ncbi:MAG: hypothetical protein R3E89_13830 [Thiolinea sp.]
MKALVIHGAKDLRIEEREIPAPQAGQIRIRLPPAVFVVRICTITIMRALAPCA